MASQPGTTEVTVRLDGMNDGFAPPPGTAQLIEDMTWDERGYWRNAPGYTLMSNLGSAPEILTMTWFTQHGGRRRWLIFETNNGDDRASLYYLDYGQGGGFGAINTSRRRVPTSGSSPTQYLQVGDRLYYIDGINPPTVWDGEVERQVGFAQAPTPPLVSSRDSGWLMSDIAGMVPGVPDRAPNELQRGVGPYPTGATGDIVQQWRKGYAVTLINERGQESPPSPVAWCSAVNENDGTSGITSAPGRVLARLRLERAPPGIVAVRLWATYNVHEAQVATGNYDLYFHSELPPHRCHITDTKPDEELGPFILNQAELGPFPLGARLLEVWRGSMWVAGMPGYSGRVQYSHPGLVEQFPVLNYIETGAPQAGSVTALKATANALYVFCERGIFAIKGNHTTGFRIETVSLSDGTRAPNSVIDLPGVGLAFLSSRGIRAIYGAREEEGYPASIVRLADPLTRTFREQIGKQNLERTQAVIDPIRQEAWWQVPDGGSAALDLGVVYHYAKDAWTLRKGYPVGCFAEIDGHVWFGSNDTSASGIYVLTDGANKGGTALSAVWQHNPIQMPQRSSLSKLVLVVLGNWSTVQVEARPDLKDRWSVESDTDRTLKDTEVDNADHRPLWNTATWSTDLDELWSDYDLVKVPIGLEIEAALVHQFRLTGAGLRLVSTRLGFDRGLGAADIARLEGD